MAEERTVYANLDEEALDARADYKLDVTAGPYGLHGYYGAFVKRRWWVFSWWERVYRSPELERCTEYLQTIIQLPRRYTRKVVPKP